MEEDGVKWEKDLVVRIGISNVTLIKDRFLLKCLRTPRWKQDYMGIMRRGKKGVIRGFGENRFSYTQQLALLFH